MVGKEKAEIQETIEGCTHIHKETEREASDDASCVSVGATIITASVALHMLLLSLNIFD